MSNITIEEALVQTAEAIKEYVDDVIETDNTLTQAGKPADAKAVGDALEQKQPIGNYALKTEIPSMPDVPVRSVNGKTGAVQLNAEDVGADASGTANSKVYEHNTSDAAHNDIRLLISGLTTRLNTLANSTDEDLDQMAELVAYIKANKSLIDSITTSKVNVSDIIDNLTTSVSNKPLSAKQGVELKALIDAIKIPTSLPASDVYAWAKHPNKPTYTASEVGAISKNNLTLGLHSDGKYYIFADGAPVGTGFEFSGNGGDVFGYVDENNNIILNGSLADGTYSIKYEMENGSTINIGNLVLDSNVYYSITNSLTQCTNSNSATQVVQGGSYSATITAKSGYELKSIVVKMGGTDISSTAVSGGTITISNVTGNIVITATATEIVASYTNLAKNFTTGRFNSSGAVDASTTAATACTDYIGPLKNGDIIRIKGFGAGTDYNSQWANASKGNNSCSKLANTSTHYSYSYDSATGIITLTKTSDNAGYTYYRISGKLTGTTDDVIITLNEPIV